ncbi:MAG: hypothetical protein JXA15_09950 [Spirochaetales bacterium]|nr:hypothetical protein [Spirochaetales bacterium]
MALITHPGTGFAVGDPEKLLLDPDALPSSSEMAAAAKPLILSASGWRKVFAASGDEDALAEDVSPADLVVAGAMAEVFADFMIARFSAPRVALGIDSRPTGPRIADAMLRVFLARGVEVRYAFMVAAPELMAWTREAALLPAGDEGRLDGFCYVSASHNPPGHNGVKFGLGSGGVLDGAEAGPLADALRTALADPATPARVAALMAMPEPADIGRELSACAARKRRARSAYLLFARRVASDREELEDQERVLDALAAGASSRAYGVVAEMNGSARSLSIDIDFLEALGLKVKAVNAAPREFAHRIVPEGASLDDCRVELEIAARSDPGFVLGYVPDCDGDRGNLVRLERSGAAVALEAQEVFALSVLSELAGLAREGAFRDGGSGRRVIVVANDATSMRVEAIARAFGAEVARAETGEANVVGLARKLREEGNIVRILGEGSNGGNITHPAAVRDPLSTLVSVLKLLCVRGDAEGPGLFRLWLEATGRGEAYRPDFDLDDIVASLPAFVTTSVFEPRAALTVREADHASLKRRYREAFLERLPRVREACSACFEIDAFRALATNGIVERELGEDWGESGRGGLRVQLLDGAGSPRAFLWMRGSGTEPVFRVMADAEGSDPALEERLLALHVEALRAADTPS